MTRSVNQKRKKKTKKKFDWKKSILETRNTPRAPKSSVQLKDFKIVILNKQILILKTKQH